LLQLDDRLGHGVIHERVAARPGDRFETRLDQRLIGYGKRQLHDDHVSQLLPLHVDPLPEAGRAEEDGVFERTEAIQQDLPRRVLALHEQRITEVVQLVFQAIGCVDQHLV